MVVAVVVGFLVAVGFLGVMPRFGSSRSVGSRLRSTVAVARADRESSPDSAGHAGRVAAGIGAGVAIALGVCWGLIGADDGIIAGVAFGGLATLAALRLGARRAARPRGRQVEPRATGGVRAAAELPAALDLLAACLSAGAPLEQALSVVAAAFDTTAVGRLLDGVARLTALGAPPESAWAAALAEPAYAVMARAVIRAHHSGTSLGEVFSRVADDRRRALRSSAEAAAARASVRAVLPLGLCFLPAFVLIGVVPVIAGFAGSMWS